ncbi:MAG: Barrel-sandwich domain of CusB or HlyD rane-fusion [Candidatus Parcubacteria bacterium]|jgi:multidrug resistance efflux pump
MKIITRNQTCIALMAVGVLVVIVTISAVRAEQRTDEAGGKKEASQMVYLEAAPVPVQVSGIVSAADQTVIYAQTAGVVAALHAREGAVVGRGTVLVEQATPAADARVMLGAAERSLSESQQSLQVLVQESGETEAIVRAYAAQEIAALRTMANSDRVQETAKTAVRSLEQQTVTVIDTINYIHQNRNLFSAAGLRTYDAVVTELYGYVPNYFRGGVMSGQHTEEALQAVVDGLNEMKEINPAQLETVMKLLHGQTKSLTQLLQTAESDIFDRQSPLVTEAKQEEYLAKRRAVLAAAESLGTTQAAYDKVIDGMLEDSVTQKTAVAVNEEDKTIAAVQTAYAKIIAAQVTAVAVAGEAVAIAEQSLGRPRAPFAGVVSTVFVNEGQYVMAGTPLLTLIGSGARELKATLPAYLLSSVAVGNEFYVNGEAVGFIDRVSTVTDGKSGTVVIALTGASVPAVGAGVVGELRASQADVYRVPRNALHFDAGGAFLVYESDVRSRVTIVYDDGQNYYLQVAEKKDEALQLAVSIGLQ